MRVRHFGNTANNAFHNLLLLERFADIESDVPIRMFGLQHAISAPAWEGVAFDVPSADWIADPEWAQFPAAADVNAAYSDLPSARASSPTGMPSATMPGATTDGVMTTIRSRVFGPLRGKTWAQPAVDFRDRRMLARRSVLPQPAGIVNILYGSSPLLDMRLGRSSRRTVSFEHGTLRWIADGRREDLAFRQAYREQVAKSAHLWVTNLDSRSLEIAEDIAPGRWSALPHPFTLDARVPFDVSPRREQLLRDTKSTHLILLPSSQNWSPLHDKGSHKALRAFVKLRQAGVDAGLVAVEWGHQLESSKDYLRKAGVSEHVQWVLPLARFSLQQMVADVDVVWDQFGLDAFGALALRVVEQGTPLVSRGLKPSAERIIGGPVPWLVASSSDEIVSRTSAHLDDMRVRGRETVILETRKRYRGWLMNQHSPELTAELQRDLYQVLIDGGSVGGAMAPDEWARRVRTPSAAPDARADEAR